MSGGEWKCVWVGNLLCYKFIHIVYGYVDELVAKPAHLQPSEAKETVSK